MNRKFLCLIDNRIREWLRYRKEGRFKEGSILQNRYRILQGLGLGSYGVTYLCDDVQTNHRCVLKRVHPVRGGRGKAETIYLRETKILSQLNCNFIPKLYDCFHYQDQLCFIMEYMDGKSLDYLLFQEGITFSEKESLQVVKHLLPIIDYIHSNGIVHRDISIANVILDGDQVRLIDFGLARELKDKENEEAVHVSSDFYAIGHLLLFLLYSTFEENTETVAAEDRSWETELTLHPQIKKLLHHLLMEEQPYNHAGEIQQDVNRILQEL